MLIVGGLFFNIPALPHAQFEWGAARYLVSIAWSLGLAFAPAAALYLLSRLSGRADAPDRRTCLLMTAVFERLVNAVHRAAPQARICFNTKPTDTAQAVQRWA